ncbi:MAG: hypothetical protein OXP66_06285 [Candidatus Tectomicrobia bacterium]|nr:hypothetical protein [Candidatus Tectomicrobia bacterium]
MQSAKRTRREISRLVLAGIMCILMVGFIGGCDPELNEKITVINNQLASIDNRVTNIDNSVTEIDNRVTKSEEMVAEIADELAAQLAGMIDARVAMVMGLRSDDDRCRADARFNVRHDGQEAFRNEVRKLMGSEPQESPADADVYERKDIARAEFYSIVAAIENAAVKHDLPLESLTTSEFPPCSIREVRSEHVPVFGKGEAASVLHPNCDVDISMTIGLRGLPPETDFWLYDAKDERLQTANEPLSYSEHLMDVPCGNEVSGVVETFAMLRREAVSREFEDQKILVHSYMKIMASYQGVAGGAIATGPHEYEEIQLGQLPGGVQSLFDAERSGR